MGRVLDSKLIHGERGAGQYGPEEGVQHGSEGI